MLPSALRPRKSAVAADSLPYAYGTVKRKCWAPTPSGVKHVCEKPAHSCLRLICSFARVPFRRQIRGVARACQAVLQAVWQGFELWNLSTAPAEIRDGIGGLTPAPPSGGCPHGCCALCGEALLHPAWVVADAGQAYEAISIAAVTQSITRLFQAARTIGLPDAVFVKKSSKFSAGFGGSIRTPYTDRTIYTFRTIELCLIGCLLLRFFILGPWILLQCSGIPIGGPHSKILLSIPLVEREHIFIRFKWPKIARALGLSADMSKALVARRYVDDVILVSRCMCRACVAPLLKVIYGSLIVFDVECDGVVDGDSVAFKYLDAIVEMNFLSVRYLHFNPNEPFIVSGGRSPKIKKQDSPVQLSIQQKCIAVVD